MTVNTEARMWQIDDPNEIVRCRSPQGKPFLRLKFATGELVEMSFALAEWIGFEGRIHRDRHALLSAPSIPARKNKPRKPHVEA